MKNLLVLAVTLISLFQVGCGHYRHKYNGCCHSHQTSSCCCSCKDECSKKGGSDSCEVKEDKKEEAKKNSK